MIDTTTTTEQPFDRGDILTRLDERLGDAIERFARDARLSRPVARAIRRNGIQRLGDAIIDAKRLTGAILVHDKG